MTSSTSHTSPFSVTSSGGKLELKIGKIFSNISFFHKNDPMALPLCHEADSPYVNKSAWF